MKNNFSRIEKLEEILTPKKKKVVILDEITDEPESWIDVNGVKYIIPPEADVEKFIQEKIKLIKGVHICTLCLSKGRITKPDADFSGLISKDDFLVSVKGFTNEAK